MALSENEHGSCLRAWLCVDRNRGVIFEGGDEDAPAVTVRFHNDWRGLSLERKLAILEAMIMAFKSPKGD